MEFRAELRLDGETFYSLTDRAVHGLTNELMIRGSTAIFESPVPQMHLRDGTALAIKIVNAVQGKPFAVIELTADEAEAVEAVMENREARGRAGAS